MSVAFTLQHYLDNYELAYELVQHPYAGNSLDVAKQANIDPNNIVKCVMLVDELGFLMAVCQASTRINLKALRYELNRKLVLATEDELADLLGDCVLGAVPPVGELYDVDMIVDDHLFEQDELYFEAGDHEDLIHVNAETFQTIVETAEHALFARPIVLH